MGFSVAVPGHRAPAGRLDRRGDGADLLLDRGQADHGVQLGHGLVDRDLRRAGSAGRPRSLAGRGSRLAAGRRRGCDPGRCTRPPLAGALPAVRARAAPGGCLPSAGPARLRVQARSSRGVRVVVGRSGAASAPPRGLLAAELPARPAGLGQPPAQHHQRDHPGGGGPVTGRLAADVPEQQRHELRAARSPGPRRRCGTARTSGPASRRARRPPPRTGARAAGRSRARPPCAWAASKRMPQSATAKKATDSDATTVRCRPRSRTGAYDRDHQQIPDSEPAQKYQRPDQKDLDGQRGGGEPLADAGKPVLRSPLARQGRGPRVSAFRSLALDTCIAHYRSHTKAHNRDTAKKIGPERPPGRCAGPVACQADRAGRAPGRPGWR